jgi:hypothetical protein
VAGCFYVYQRYEKNKLEQELNNQIAQLQQTVKETQTAYSRLATEADNLKTENKKLNKIIKDRDEEIVSLTDIIVKLKDKIADLENLVVTITDSNGNEIELDKECKECLVNVRFMVAFSENFDYLNVSGQTWTNPGEAHLELKWLRPLRFSLILAKDEKDNFRAYLDSKDSDIESVELNLKVDPSVFDVKFYERLAVGANIGLGDGLLTSVSANILIFDNWFVGPFFATTFDGKDIKKFYGGNVLWQLFK